MAFSFGTKSVMNAKDVNPRLWAVAKLALTKSTVDFGVASKINGARTAEEQHELWRSGREKPGPKITDKDGYHSKSNHQITADNTGHAIDLTAWVNGGWEFDDWRYYYHIAWAMCQAAQELGIKIRWGGNWNEDLMKCQSLEDVIAMAKRYKGRLPDGPHFELAP